MAKTPKVQPVQVYVEHYSCTPGGQHVHIVYRGLDVTSGPLAQSCRHVTDQDTLAEHAPAKFKKLGGGDYWSDAEIDAELLDHLSSIGIAATVVPNPAITKLERIAVDMTRIDAARRRAALSRSNTALSRKKSRS